MLNFYQAINDKLKNSNSKCYVYYDETHYYPEMYENIEKFNSILKDYSANKIVFFTGKSFYAYCGIFSILLSGNVWVPVNPELPEKRIIEMIQLANPSVILIDRDIPSKIKSFIEERAIRIVNVNNIIKSNSKSSVSLNHIKKNDTAYIMFTSGSTGIPKGVPMTHKNFINFIENAINILPFKTQEVFSDFHDLGFDISIFYLFCCVLTESAFAPFMKREELFFPIDHIIQNKITVWSSVPSAISRIMTMRPDENIHNSIRIMFLCGEPFRLDVLKYCYNNLKVKNIYNFYGLTETGVENFYHYCSINDLIRFKKKGFVPIGKPLPGNNIKISSNKELLLSGCQITPGYIGNIAQDRFELIDNTRWFHTGDIIEKFEDVYFCKGRLDTQVKLSGYRVELMDVETHLRNIEGISDSVCFVNNSTLHCAVETSGSIDEKKIVYLLKKELPSYMIPKKYFYLKCFPKNKNGKIDRNFITKQFLKT